MDFSLNPGALEALLKPRNIALIGASERAPHAAALMRNLFRFGFPKENIYPVNPRYEQLFDLPCFPSVGAVPGDVDLAVIAIPRDGTVAVLEECAAKGVRAALTVATGFGEFDETGRGYQAELVRIVRESGMALAGPNTLGYLALESGAALWSSPLPEHLTTGSVSAVFSSAGLLNLFLNTAADRCLGFRYAIAPGNQVGAGFADYLRAAVDDDGTRVIVAVIESMSRPEEMAELLDLAREREKVVVALRLGRSQKGGRAVTSHSGNMATSGAVWDGLFRQKGVIPVDNLDQMLEVTALAVGTPEPYRLPAAGGVGIVTISGGDCSFLADICERNDVDLPEPSGATYEALRKYFDKESFNGNPLDIEELHWANRAGYLECLETFMADDNFAVVCCRLNLPKSPSDRLTELYRESAAALRRGGKPFLFLSRASEQLDRSWFEFFNELGVPLLLEYEKSLRAVRDVLALSRRRADAASGEDVAAVVADPQEAEALRGLLAGGDASHATVRRLLRAYGIPVVPEHLAGSREAALEAAEEMRFPVALKVESPDLPHKTEAGGVRLNLASADELAQAYDRLLEDVGRNAPDARIDGVLVQKMVQGVAEVIIGTSRTPDLGICLAFGLGGIYTEVLKDVAFRLPPLGPADAHDMIQEIRTYPLLTGARGRPRADVAALAEAIVALSRLALDFREEVNEIEFNPLMVLPEGQGVLAVDTLVRCAAHGTTRLLSEGEPS
ncbi:MAG: acetate--CoA ligase family protein [Deltaproteobacteria bacterium]|nr:acetate--CoA ligase family protein [Deltaproteobacteria bacterium]